MTVHKCRNMKILHTDGRLRLVEKALNKPRRGSINKAKYLHYWRKKEKRLPQHIVDTESLRELMEREKNELKEGKSIEDDQIHTKH